MSTATVWISVVVLSACSSEDSTQHWTALVDSNDTEDVSIAHYADLDLVDDHESTFAVRGVMEAETAGLVDIVSVPATWQPRGDTIAVHIDETVVPMGGTMPDMDVSCEAAPEASLACTFDGVSYTFEAREEAPVSGERWTLVEMTDGSETETYPTARTVEHDDGTWDETVSIVLTHDNADVTMSVTETLSGGGALHSTEDRVYGTWAGYDTAVLYFDEKTGLTCDNIKGDEMTCDSFGTVTVWQRE